jgi:hypothetical protein
LDQLPAREVGDVEHVHRLFAISDDARGIDVEVLLSDFSRECIEQAGPVEADGSARCEALLEEGDTRVSFVIDDPDGADGADSIQLTVRANAEPEVAIVAPDGEGPGRGPEGGEEPDAARALVLDDAREIVTWALLANGLNINQITDKSLNKIKPTLEQWLPLVKVYDSDSPKTALLNGDVAIGVVWGGEGAILANKNKKFRWVIPSEGTHLFIDSLAIPKTAKNVENAEAFMNFILRPEISKQISDEFPYLNPNLAARELMSKKQLENPASFPAEEELKKMTLFKDIGTKGSDVEELITTLKAQ